jgi:hypothetical protein
VDSYGHDPYGHDSYSHSPLENEGPEKAPDPRYFPRFKLETAIRIYARNCAVVRGRTVDISESGIAAVLPFEVSVGEVVRLEFSLPAGDVDILALGRQRRAFRYGFQFVEFSRDNVIGLTCRQLALDAAVHKSAAAAAGR